ncbi:hypothetical protein FQN50_002055 [Emmonsiellopsis sp. PD_5]|nr:hypothetical protein FQN50_002055 [Emmonsiellopsis sp. PD_5]
MVAVYIPLSFPLSISRGIGSTPSNMEISPFGNDEYTVGWICALQEEFEVAMAMLTDEHGLPQFVPEHDNNVYILGNIGQHKVAMACLPAGSMGIGAAAVVANNMHRTFKSLRFGLLVGIGGGVPNPKTGKDIRLGDVVVSIPKGTYGGVVQYNYGKTTTGGVFQRRGHLNAAPAKLRSCVTALQAVISRQKNPKHYVRDALLELENTSDEYKYPKHEDLLFDRDCPHIGGSRSGSVCGNCNKTALIERTERKSSDPAIHLGTIASGDIVIGDSVERDHIDSQYDNLILCFEMEAAGLMNNFPCLVIRGISDYADSHKNDHWRSRAIAAASAYTKTLLNMSVRPDDVSNLPQLTELMSVVQTIDQNLTQVQERLNQGFTTIQKDTSQNTRKNILDWITPTDYDGQQNDYLALRHEGTGAWFLSQPEYRAWLEAGNQVLYCPGIPGAGKTVLTAIESRDQKVEDYLACLLKQLLRRRPNIPVDVEALYSQHAGTRAQLSLAKLRTLLNSVSSLFWKLYVVVDALDECPTVNQCQARFITELLSIHRGSGANIFATSRINEDIAKAFSGYPALQISAARQDVEVYVTKRAEYFRPDILDDETRNTVISAILQRVDGMFLFYARRRLSVEELQYALAVKPNTTYLNQDFIPSARIIKSSCAGLVTIDTTSKVVRLVHHTTQEYFNQTKEKWFPSLEEDLTTACITYLSFEKLPNSFHAQQGQGEVFVYRDAARGGDVIEILDKEESLEFLLQYHFAYNPFYSYAGEYWGFHAHSSSIDGTTLVLNALSFAIDCSIDEWTPYRRLVRVDQGNVALLKDGLFKADCQDGYWRTPLSYAAEQGQTDALVLLLDDWRANSEIADANQRTPVSYAAEMGHKSAVALLLHRKVKADSGLSDKSKTPLLYAASKGHTAVIKLLVENGANPDAADVWGNTPMFHAAINGAAAAVKLLLHFGADPNLRGSIKRRGDTSYTSGMTPLAAATEIGQVEVVRVLLATSHVDIDTQDEDGLTPLSYAALHGSVEIVNLFLKTGRVNPNSNDGPGRTMMSYAVIGGHEGVGRLLLATGQVDRHSTDASGRRPLDYLADPSYEIYYSPKNPPWAAALGNDTYVAKYILRLPNAMTENRYTLSHVAGTFSYIRQRKIVELLSSFDKSTKLDSKGGCEAEYSLASAFWTSSDEASVPSDMGSSPLAELYD